MARRRGAVVVGARQRGATARLRRERRVGWRVYVIAAAAAHIRAAGYTIVRQGRSADAAVVLLRRRDALNPRARYQCMRR